MNEDIQQPEKDAIIWNKLKGLKAWDVYIVHNFWDGSRYSSGARPFSVLATSKDHAKLILNNNLNTVEEYFRTRRIRRGAKTIRLIRKSEQYKINSGGIHLIKPSALLSGKILNADGKWIKFNKEDY